MRRASSAALVAALLALAACGGGSPQDAVRKTATQYAHALADGDADKACDLMSSVAKRQIVVARPLPGRRDCLTTMKNVVASLDDSVRNELRDYRVTNVEITGEHGRVEDNAALDTGEEDAARLPLVKEGDRWLIAGPDQVNDPRAAQGDDTTDP